MPVLKTLLHQIELANRKYHLFHECDSIVVGVSGGPDSVALLTLLSKLKRKYSLKIVAAHLNHGLSKKQAHSFYALAKESAEALKVPFYSKTVAVKRLAKRGKRSLEEMGRMVRYQFFEEIAAKTKCRKIATAHTLDDQAETVLMRIFRGSGLRGLTGILYKRKQGRFEVIRPLLSVEKAELTAFLKENRIRFCKDKTNVETLFTRNRVRHGLLPKIAKDFNPQIKKSLANLQSICTEIQDYLQSIASEELKKSVRQTASSSKKLSLSLAALRRLKPVILRETLFAALTQHSGSRRRLTYAHIQGITDIVASKKTNLETHLPGPMTVKKTAKSLDFIGD